ncbi:MAG: HAD family phosphatase [Bacteroidaceae bacterium]|nr:HAD family phosphatase [Bacteroidaceae bacterium]
MDKPVCKAALFDFDGTLVDTEPQYSIFWGRQGERYHPEIPNFERVIKGQTLGQIFDGYFSNMPEVQKLITEELNEFEQTMKFAYISGAKEYVLRLREKGIKTAIVTSSNDKKMAHVYRACPEVKEMFDLILTSDMFTRSKPDPDCFLTAANLLGCTPDECVVYEDSLHGLQAARNACMRVIALATTLPAERIAPLADEVWTDFNDADID